MFSMCSLVTLVFRLALSWTQVAQAQHQLVLAEILILQAVGSGAASEYR